MCDLATASLVATGLGTAAQIQGQQQAKRDMGKAQEAENARQKKLRGEASALFNESLGSEGQANTIKAEDKAIQERQGAAAAAQAGGIKADVGSSYGNKSEIVADESKVRNTVAKNSAGIEAAAKAKLAGFGDAGQLNAIKNARMRLGQGIIAGNMAGSAAALAPELDFSSHAGDSMKNIGAGLQTAGMLSGMAASSGVGSLADQEAFANANLDEAGFINSGDGSMTLRPIGDGNYLHMQTNQIISGKDIDWSHYATNAQVNWANKPFYMKLFGEAPAWKAPAPSASVDWFKPMTFPPLPKIDIK